MTYLSADKSISYCLNRGLIIATVMTKARKLLGILGTRVWRDALFTCGVAAGVEHRAVLRHLANIQTITDIGANRGQFALVARDCFPGARIYSFEPLRDPARRFRRVFARDSNVYLCESAVGDQNGEATIHISGRTFICCHNELTRRTW